MSLLHTHGFPFLAVYLGLGVLLLCVMLAVRRVLCGPWGLPLETPLLDAHELAYLAGGTDRLAEVAKAAGSTPDADAIEAKLRSLDLLVPTWKGGISYLVNISFAGFWLAFGVYRIYSGFFHEGGVLAPMLLMPVVLFAFFAFIALVERDSLFSGYGGDFIEAMQAKHEGWKLKTTPIGKGDEVAAISLFGTEVLNP